MNEDFSNDSLLELYLFESTTLLDSLDALLLKAEGSGTLAPEQVNEIFRIMHTIKGSSAMMSFDVISEVAHRTEDLFSVVREHGIKDAHYAALFDVTIKAAGFLEAEVTKIEEGGDLAAGAEALLAELGALYGKLREGIPEKPLPDLGRVLGGAPGLAQTPPREIKQPEPREPVMAQVIPFGTREAAASKREAAPEAPGGPAPDVTPQPQAAAQAPQPQAAAQAPQPQATVVAPVATQTPMPAAGGIAETYYLHVFFNEGSKMENIRAFMLVSKLAEAGTVNRTIPDELETNPDVSAQIIDDGLYVSFTTGLMRGQVEALAKSTLSVESVSFVRKMPDEAEAAPPVKLEAALPVIETPPVAAQVRDAVLDSRDKPGNDVAPPAPVAAPAAAPSAPAAKDAPAPGHAASKDTPVPQNLISVDLNKLDNLLDLVGEIVINESMVTQSPDLEGLELVNFRKAARQLGKLTDELQDSVMSVRMVPIATTFTRMRRIVRDMGKQLGKEAELLLVGENTEVDKTILDTLGDPLMHLVRNAMDHAIEPPEERASLGKTRTGRIVLSAQNVGSDIVISVSDDGRGLNAGAILAKAEERGMLRKAPEEYSDREIFAFLMLPGFSTRSEVTEYSGRGVGLDVVKNSLDKIGGSIVIESAPGLGTNIFLKIPLTLAIIDCMEVRLGADIYAIPVSNIRESFKASAGQLLTGPGGEEMILLRGTPYPIVRLYENFRVKEAVRDPADGILILTDAGDRAGCLLADELVGKFQVVVKAIPPYLAQYGVKSTGIAGCTIMGNGEISLIVDVGELLS